MAGAVSQRTFGIELEFIARHAIPPGSSNQLHATVSQHIQRYTGLKVIHSEVPNYADYRYGRLKRTDWLIVKDPSVNLSCNDFRYSRERQLYPGIGMATWLQFYKDAEIVSPILTENNWGQVEAILDAIKSPPMAVIHNKSTSTHIHIGIQPHSMAPLDTEAALHDLKRVAAVYYIFETYLNLLCPDHRVNSFCHRTRRSYFGKKARTERDFCEAVYSIQRLQDLHYLMNCDGLSGRDQTPITNRYYGANFANCANVWEKWTVEFRSHEGTKNKSDLQFWGKLLMRLFDQAVAADWDFIMYLCDTSESFNTEGACGDINGRDLNAWRTWAASIHCLFIVFLAGPVLRGKHMNMTDLAALEKNILSQPSHMTDKEYADRDVRPVREEELLLQNLIHYMLAREDKFRPQYERFMSGNFADWSSDNPRDDLPGDWVDYPNPSGIVLDEFGKDIPIIVDGHATDYAQYPAA